MSYFNATPSNDILSNRIFFLSFLLLASAFAYIICLVINPRYSWVLPEAFYYKSFIMQNIPLHSLIKGSFNTQVFEYSDRITRPLSSTFEILDTHFRAWLWHYIRPITSLSLTFLFSLLLGPWLFFKFLNNIGIRPAIATLATAIMLLNPGSLSLIVMLFRPAKAMMNFGLIFSLYFASLIYLHDTRKQHKGKITIDALCLSIGVLLSFLFDETAVVIVGAILVFFPTVFLKNYRRVLGFSIVPLVLLSLYLLVFPKLSVYYGYAKPNILTYSAISTPSIPKISIVISNYLENTFVIFKESLGLFDPLQIPKFGKKILMLLAIISVTFFIGSSVSKASVILKNCKPETKKILLKSLFLILALCLFHTILLDTVGDVNRGRIWGPYWYGAYFGIFFGIFIAALGEVVAQSQHKVSYGFVAMSYFICLALMVVFPYTNFMYRDFHFYPYRTRDIENVYRGDINRFSLYEPKTFDNIKSLTVLWRNIKEGHPLPHSLRKDIYWVPLEMGILNKYPVPNNVVVTMKYAQQHDFDIPLS